MTTAKEDPFGTENLNAVLVKFSLDIVRPRELYGSCMHPAAMRQMADRYFVDADDTLDHFIDVYSPRVGERNARRTAYFKESIERETEALLNRYDRNPPNVDAEVMRRVKAVLDKSCLGEKPKRQCREYCTVVLAFFW